jgi:flagellin-like protein
VRDSGRGQSETIGVLLLTGVVVIAVGTVGFLVLSSGGTDQGPVTNVVVDVNGTDVVLAHDGGRSVAESEVAVVVDGASRERYALTDLTRADGDTDGDFEPGERWRVGHGVEPGGSVRVVVVHEPSGRVLRNEVQQVPDGGSLLARFEYDPPNPASGESVDFDASRTFAGGSVVAYEWDFDGDGTTDATGEQVTHTYTSTGEYDATLTVETGSGLTATRTRTVTVTREDTEPPSISSFGVTNPSGQNVRVAFDSDEQLSTIAVDISNAESATLTEGDFTESGSGGTYTYTATYAGASDGTYDATLTTATDGDGNDGAAGQSDSVTVDTTAPTFASTSLTDSEDGNGIVTSGDSVNVSATVSDATAGVGTVTADASAFDAGTVTLTDGNGDGVYNTTFTVGQNPVEGDQTVTVTAADTAGNAGSTTTDVIELDTTAPTISLFEINDNSEDLPFGETEYDVQWSVSDENLETATVQLEGGITGTIYEDISEPSGDRILTGSLSGFSYIIRIEAVDAAGNDICREITDTADGSGSYSVSDASDC